MGQMLEEDSMSMDLYQKAFLKKAKITTEQAQFAVLKYMDLDSDACSLLSF